MASPNPYRKDSSALGAELERLKTVTLFSKYSQLKTLRNDELIDQLKVCAMSSSILIMNEM